MRPGQAYPPLAMTRPPFAGSLRLQPLYTVSNLRFAVVKAVSPASLIIELLHSLPRREFALPLAGFLAPWRRRVQHLIQFRLLDAFVAEAAGALIETAMPFAVALDSAGVPTRPPDLWDLLGETPAGGGEGVRLRLGQHAKMLGEHLGKHFGVATVDSWQLVLAELRRRGMPVRPSHLAAAVRLADRHGTSSPPQGQPWEAFGAVGWPLAEFYTAAVALLAQELDSAPAVHAARQPQTTACVPRNLLAELREMALHGHIDPRQEVVSAWTGGMTWVAKGHQGAAGPLLWATAYPVGDGLAKLRKDLHTLTNVPQVEVRANHLVRT